MALRRALATVCVIKKAFASAKRTISAKRATSRAHLHLRVASSVAARTVSACLTAATRHVACVAKATRVKNAK